MEPQQGQSFILEEFRKDQALKDLEEKISSFNIFEAVGMIRQEIKHSNFLQFLLNPSEKHQLGDLFLKKLLMHIRHSADEETPLDNLDIPNANFTDADVRREWKNTDLLIYSPSNDFVCTIENKVDSTEGFDQLETYETVINKEFPGAKKLFVFLTRDGIAASYANWLSLSYGAIADIIEQICDERGKSMNPDIQISMRHYIDLIRRYIMSESDIADLCRKIYKEHRQAIDLIYEHRPDLRSDIEEFIYQLIQESASTEKLELDSINKRWIRELTRSRFLVPPTTRMETWKTCKKKSKPSGKITSLVTWKSSEKPSTAHLRKNY